MLRIDVGSKLVQSPEEIFPGHVRDGILHAVASAMQTVQVTAQRTFPKEIGQRVRLDFVMAVQAIGF